MSFLPIAGSTRDRPWLLSFCVKSTRPRLAVLRGARQPLGRNESSHEWVDRFMASDVALQNAGRDPDALFLALDGPAPSQQGPGLPGTGPPFGSRTGCRCVRPP